MSELPQPVAAALGEIEADLATVTPAADAARLVLGHQVATYLQGRLDDDPIALALLSRPAIFAWCLERAVQETEAPPPELSSRSVRKAEPLLGGSGAAVPAEEATTPSTSTTQDPPSKSRDGGKK
ncbi:hypothetical protein [Pseudonocardia cypriaca]|uniref:Uncharacterized protein n=1 Tax=Pseudonocardia cypriaca TaxID=882449 RepID=A0A543FSW9_9PSEU|nr:hypothetical protein [Pseudonocardia cypriaca]TQM36854.1 hypothetical protein FB388_4041 [Pseudonocardia cypriaca]